VSLRELELFFAQSRQGRKVRKGMKLTSYSMFYVAQYGEFSAIILPFTQTRGRRARRDVKE